MAIEGQRSYVSKLEQVAEPNMTCEVTSETAAGRNATPSRYRVCIRRVSSLYQYNPTADGAKIEKNGADEKSKQVYGYSHMFGIIARKRQ